MPTARPFAYNTGAKPGGTKKIGNLTIGLPTAGFVGTGLNWWNGPDEDLGYVICKSVPGNTQPTTVPGTNASVSFFRSKQKTEASFLALVKTLFSMDFANGLLASNWLNANGYWTSFNVTVAAENLIYNLDAGDLTSYPGSGSTWYDISDSGYNTSLISNPIYSSSPGYITTNGTNQYMELANTEAFDFGTSDFTVEYWFRKLADTSSFDNISGVNKWTNGQYNPSGCEFSLGIGNGSGGAGNTFAFSIGVGTTNYSTGQSPTAITLNSWQHAVGMRSGNKLISYLNGVLQKSTTPTGFTVNSVMNNSSGRRLRISALSYTSGASYTKADSAIVRIYNRALTADEVLASFNADQYRFGTIITAPSSKISTTTSSPVVTGENTQFTETLAPGDIIYKEDGTTIIGIVDTIINDTELVLVDNSTVTTTDELLTTNDTVGVVA